MSTNKMQVPENKENLNSIVHLAQTLLLRIKDKSSITPMLIAEKVAIVLALDPEMADGVDTQNVIDELVRRFSLWIGEDSILSSDEGHEAWLNAARKKDWRYWSRYSGWLERKMSATAVDSLGESTDHILGLLEDPKREGAWDRRGLVVGHVQSGKTGNYSGLVCKAADAGYKLIIVLAGLHNNLRSQTQIRLEESFLGYETSASGDAVKMVGVGEIDSDTKIFPACFTNRSNNGDFNTKVANHLANRPEERPWLFVVKKNKTVLERLLKWIRNHVADATDSSGRRYVSGLPLLLIDDEADHASVDTGEQIHDADGLPDDEYQPKAINSRIRKILHSFSKSSYVGYTATPFANVFIHRRNATKDEGPDLFPSAFIINLAAPSNYVGPARIFGLNRSEGRTEGLPLTRIISDHVNADKTGGWMPAKHNKEHIPSVDGVDTLPKSLEQAVNAFVIACAVRNLRGQTAEHSSMLIHVTRFTAVQGEVHRQVENQIRRMRQRILRGIDQQETLVQLHSLWTTDFEPTYTEFCELAGRDEGLAPPMNPSWSSILDALPQVLEDIEVKMINGTAKDALDYANSEGKGLKIIAIGGDKLARGLTLEGLCTSYFVRTSKMYDTLMQMGRWFGYRPGYLDVCRLYTTEDLIEWFGHIADASEELREEFDVMVQNGDTPKDYGMKVKAHDILLVTSPLKMRSAETLHLSFSGDLIQTVVLHTDEVPLEKNLKATNKLLESMGVPTERTPTKNRDDTKDQLSGAFVWSGIGHETVIEFLSAYSTHKDAYRVNSAMLVKFIEKMVIHGELTSWTVALMGVSKGNGGAYTFESGITVDSMPMRGSNSLGKGKYSIGVLTDPSDEGIDLDDLEWTAALNMTKAAWKPDPARNRINQPTKPSGKMIRIVRGLGTSDIPPSPDRGLLLLYPVSPLSEGAKELVPKNWSGPIMGFAISFPASESGETVAYKVDHLKWEEEYGAAD
ncbi:Conserved hypothetical protein [Herminiimonas arsenicoxydans]|uniref:Putative endonuclease Z1 domain-containing protein n=1 Tax=Herminiimonas arsenicoxydans TaxID=204773 RepID=A4G662_HERAR|nr:Conserved hypothetical protein [Herminiimonas arsenicoxydans]